MTGLSRSVAFLAGFLALAGTTAPQQLHHVWVVNSPSQLQSAVDSAADGDAVLVKASGDYGLSVQAKSLTVIADPPADVRIYGAVIQNLTDSQQVVLRGLRFRPTDDDPGLSLSNNQGLVWIEDCRVFGTSYGGWDVRTIPGLVVDRCTDVVLLRTSSSGSGVDPYFNDAGPSNQGFGLWLRGSSRVVAHGCAFHGADGHPPGPTWDDFPNSVAPGAAGFFSQSSGDQAFLSDCTATGGDGDYGGDYLDCSSGGPGISSAGTTWVFDTRGAGGQGGSGWGCSLPTAPALTGNVYSLPGDALRFSVTAPVREGQSYQLDFLGPPNTPVWFLTSPSPLSRFRPQGPLLLEMPAASLSFAGVTDAAGVLQLTRTMPAMPPGLELGRLYAQAFYTGAQSRVGLGGTLGGSTVGRIVFGGASMFLALDQSF